MTTCNVKDWHITEVTVSKTDKNFGIYDLRQRCTQPIVHSTVFHQHMLLWMRPTFRSSFNSTLRYSIDGIQGNLGPLFFLPAGMELKTISPLGNFDANFVLYTFSPDLLDYAQLSSGTCARDLRRCVEIRNQGFTDILRKMRYECINPSVNSEVVLRCLSEIMTIELFRYFDLDSGRSKIRSVGGKLCGRSIKQVRDFVESFPDRVPSVQEIAVEFGCTSGFLGRSFRETTGEPLKDYINRARIYRARTMIEHSDATLDIIAQRVGFADASSFSRAFSKATGMRPGAYRSGRALYT
jgi:AraC family transcriptional regulator